MISTKDLTTIFEIDWVTVIIASIVLLCIVVIVWRNIDELKNKLGIKTKRDIEHELLVKTSQNLSDLQERHEKDMDDFRSSQAENVRQSIRHDEIIREDLQCFTTEIRKAIDDLNKQMQTYSDNRVHDRAQSFEIQKELTNSIKAISDGGKKREVQIDALMVGSRELLGAEIDRRFDKYIAMQGIPSDEYDEFVSLHDAYNGCHGNHNRDVKFDYVVHNLPVLPVEAKLKRVNDE